MCYRAACDGRESKLSSRLREEEDAFITWAFHWTDKGYISHHM